MKSIQKRGQGPAKAGQQGFALGYILLVVALLGVIALAISRASSGPSPQASGETNRVYAATVIKLGSDLRDAASRFAVDHDITTMTLATTAGVGLYDPALSLAMEVAPPAQVFGTGGTVSAFLLNKADIIVTNAGGTGPEIALALPGVADGFCRAINNVLYGDAVTLAVPTTVGARLEGCASLTISGQGAASNVYFKVIQPA